MDSRFERVWARMREERARGEGLDQVMARRRSEELVAALAAAARDHPAEANALATELLNRLRRAPYLGAFAMSVLVVVLVYALDFAYTGTFLILDSGARAYALVILTALAGLVSLASFQMWRGRWPWLRFMIRPPRGY